MENFRRYPERKCDKMVVLNKVKTLCLYLAIILLAGVLPACGSSAVISSAERPDVPADKVEIVLFHRTQR
jgi:hypothetical protein